MTARFRLYPLAFTLLVATLLFNVLEGALAIGTGVAANSIVLVSFGAQSGLEIMAGMAVIWRLSYSDEEAGERAEKRALRFIGFTFLLLAGAIVFQAAVAFAGRDGADASPLGIGVLVASLTVMPGLALLKLRTAARANLPALAAEAKEMVACSYTSLTVLAGLVATAALGFWWIDPLAALLMTPWLIREGIEGLRGDACFEGAVVCWRRECWFGLRKCTDAAT